MKTLFIIFCIFLNILYGDSSLISTQEYYKNKPTEEKKFYDFKKLVFEKGIALNDSKSVNIFIIYPGNQVSDYWRRSTKSFIKRLEELNIKYKLTTHFFTNGEEKILFDVLKKESNYLVFTLDIQKHLNLINMILNEKKTKLILQNITTPILKLSRQPLLYDGFDHVSGAITLAKEYIKRVGQKGNYAILYGTNGYVSKMRGNGFEEYIKKNSSLKMVESYYIGFDKQKAKLATYDLIKTNKDLKFIYACSTDIALGVVEALEELGLKDKILVNGWGGGSAELKSITEKRLDFTVMRMNDDNGVAMAEAIKLDITNKTDQIPLIFSGDFELITQEIKEEKLDQLKKRAFRYSNENDQNKYPF